MSEEKKLKTVEAPAAKNIEMPATVGMTMEQQLAMMKELLMAVLEKSKEPSQLEQIQLDKMKAEDERKEQRRMNTRAQLNQTIAETKQRHSNCAHLREDNTSNIAWYTFTNGGVPVRLVGVCQRCNRTIETSDPDYHTLAKLPTRLARY